MITQTDSPLFSCSFRSLALLLFIPALLATSFAAPESSTRTERLTEPSSLLQFTAGGHVLGFDSNGMYAATGDHALRVAFVNANKVHPLADTSPGEDGKGAPLGRVSYADLWNGTTLVYAGDPNSVYTTTYHLAAGADPNLIRLRYNAPLTLNSNGTLNIAFESGTLTESAPIAWQDIDGRRDMVPVAFEVRGQEVGFALGAYDPQHPLTIDPSVVWNTFLGGSASDAGNGITVDGSGNLYVVGTSSATWGSPVRAFTSNSDVFVAKLDPATGNLIWNTFLGGSGADVGNAIAVDGSANLYVTGGSAATWGTPVRAYTATGNDVFAAQLDAVTGGLTWNTFLGGTGTDTGSGIAVDGSGNAFVAGFSSATWGTPVRAYTATGNDAVIAKLDSAGVLVWNTFLGASGTDSGNSIAVDGSGNVFVAGRSAATWESPVRAYSSSFDAFVAKLNATTGVLTFNTFLGASGSDEADCIALDGSGNLYVAGFSSTTWGSPVQAYTASSFDAFAAKLDTASGNLTWNTFMGGSGQDLGKSIAVSAAGNLLVSGNSTATWGSPLRAYTASEDGFAARLDAATGVLSVNTFLGDSGIDGGASIAADGSGNGFVAGSSGATWDSPVRAFTASNDAFAARLDFTLALDSTLNSVGANDGWILETSETSGRGGRKNSGATTINLGDDAAKKQFRGILSFDTATLPDNAVITSVALSVKKAGAAGGGNPVNNFRGFMVDIKNGDFGTPSLQPGDFRTPASRTIGPVKPPLVSGRYTINLTAAKQFINLTGDTQIRLRFKLDDNNKLPANILKLFSGNSSPANTPRLVIEYTVP